MPLSVTVIKKETTINLCTFVVCLVSLINTKTNISVSLPSFIFSPYVSLKEKEKEKRAKEKRTDN